MSTPKRRGDSQTPSKSPAPSKGTPATRGPQSPPTSAKKKSASSTPKSKQLAPSSSPAPRAPPSTPVPVARASKAAANSGSGARTPSASASPKHGKTPPKARDPATLLEDGTSLVLDTVEATTTATVSPNDTRKRARSSTSNTTPRRASRVRLQTEADVDVEDEEAVAAAGGTQDGEDVAPVDTPTAQPSRPMPAAIAALAQAHRGTARSSTSGGGLRALVEQTVLQTSTVAPDVSGIRCFAFNEREDSLVLAREDGSLVAYHLAYHQNIPHFTARRHTGGCLRRTITRLAYVRVPVTDSDTAQAVAAERDDDGAFKQYLLASYLSGQLVFLDCESLSPVAVHQRTGGAIWDFCVVRERAVVYTAVADGSWRQLRLTMERHTQAHPSETVEGSRAVAWRPTLVLERIVPGVPGADRALSVTCAPSLRLVVGTDDAGNVNAWRLPREQLDAAATHTGRGGGLADHETVWTTRLPKGIPLCCAVSGLDRRPAVAVGTSVGDVVMLDAQTGDVFATFSQHKGPVSTITYEGEAFYASGWHDSLRAYRCSADGEWYPAEVKRRTHYHEATQVAVLPMRQLLLSAARDGTLLYAPLSQVFTAPAMYVRATTQQFGFSTDKNVLVQTRLNRVEAFRMNDACSHWAPLFSYALDGHFHISRLWVDAALHHLVVATDERVVLLKVVWRSGAEEALVVSRLEEVRELAVGRGVLDACFAPLGQPASVYILYDESVVQVSLAPGYAVVTTPLAWNGATASASPAAFCPDRLFVLPSSQSAISAPAIATDKTQSDVDSSTTAAAPSASLVVYGRQSTWRCDLTPDGLPNTDTITVTQGNTLALSVRIPALHAAARAAVKTEEAAQEALPTMGDMMVGLSATSGRFVCRLVEAAASPLHAASPSSSSPSPSSAWSDTVALPKTLPHDCTFVAYLPIDTTDFPGGRLSLSVLQRKVTDTEEKETSTRPRMSAREDKTTTRAERSTTEYLLFGYFSKGILVASRWEWRMLHRCSLDTAAALKDGAHVLFVEQNLERVLEALPLCWKVRRFGN